MVTLPSPSGRQIRSSVFVELPSPSVSHSRDRFRHRRSQSFRRLRSSWPSGTPSPSLSLLVGSSPLHRLARLALFVGGAGRRGRRCAKLSTNARLGIAKLDAVRDTVAIRVVRVRVGSRCDFLTIADAVAIAVGVVGIGAGAALDVVG